MIDVTAMQADIARSGGDKDGVSAGIRDQVTPDALERDRWAGRTARTGRTGQACDALRTSRPDWSRTTLDTLGTNRTGGASGPRRSQLCQNRPRGSRWRVA